MQKKLNISKITQKNDLNELNVAAQDWQWDCVTDCTYKRLNDDGEEVTFYNDQGWQYW